MPNPAKQGGTQVDFVRFQPRFQPPRGQRWSARYRRRTSRLIHIRRTSLSVAMKRPAESPSISYWIRAPEA